MRHLVSQDIHLPDQAQRRCRLPQVPRQSPSVLQEPIPITARTGNEAPDHNSHRPIQDIPIGEEPAVLPRQQLPPPTGQCLPPPRSGRREGHTDNRPKCRRRCPYQRLHSRLSVGPSRCALDRAPRSHPLSESGLTPNQMLFSGSTSDGHKKHWIVNCDKQYRFAFGDRVVYPYEKGIEYKNFSLKNDVRFYMGDDTSDSVHVYRSFYHDIV
jgi:hypothetical protein